MKPRTKTKKMPAKWHAWNDGEAAHARGSALTDNPYRGFNDYLAEQWAFGWLSANNRVRK